MEESQPRMSTTGEFMSRMEGDTQTRRREKFINELSANAPATPEHAGATQAQVQAGDAGGRADCQGALEEEHRAGDEAAAPMGPARRLLLRTLLPAMFYKVPRKGGSNTHLNVAGGLVPMCQWLGSRDRRAWRRRAADTCCTPRCGLHLHE
eukprot:scaffold9603_cov65-Phaeocystis_antarctica.AAC.3